MSNVANVAPVLATLGNLKAVVQKKWKDDDAQWLQFSVTFEGLDKGSFQYSQAALADLATFEQTDWTDRKLFVSLVNYQVQVDQWSQNEDQREGLGLPQLPYPAPPAEVAAFATLENVSLVPIPPAAPVPVVQGMTFSVPGGFRAVIGPNISTGGGFSPNQVGAIFICLSGDTVPPNMIVAAPDGKMYVRHNAKLMFGEENWYTQVG